MSTADWTFYASLAAILISALTFIVGSLRDQREQDEPAGDRADGLCVRFHDGASK